MSNYLERLYSELPRNFRNADIKQQLQLKRYLDIVVEGAFQPLHEETANILNLLDIDRVPSKYLPNLASALGFTFPYDLDQQTQRTYIKNAVRSYKIKGTKQALEFMIRELTRFETEIVIDEENKNVRVRLAVDSERRDYANILAKIDFLISEYCPPVRDFQIVDHFLFDDTLRSADSDAELDVLVIKINLETETYAPNIQLTESIKVKTPVEIEEFALIRITDHFILGTSVLTGTSVLADVDGDQLDRAIDVITRI